jgi:tetratricopeptide (TPR) repeat protein
MSADRRDRRSSTRAAEHPADSGRRPGARTAARPALWRNRELWVGVGLFLLALTVRLLYLWESSDNPTFTSPIVDSRTYDNTARELAEQGRLGYQYFWQPFFYPFVLAGLYKLSGASILFAKMCQAAVGALTCALTGYLGTRVFDRRTGVLAGLLLAFYGPAFFYEGELVVAGWAALCSVVLLLIILRAARTQSLVMAFVLGFSGALATAVRPTFLPVVAAAGVWVAVVYLRQHRAWRPAAALALAAGGFALIAVRLRWRASVSSRATGFCRGRGLHLYIGNNPARCHTLTARPGTTRWFSIVEPRLQPDQTFTWAATLEHSEELARRTRRYAAEQPLDFIAGLAHKTAQFFNGREVPRNLDVYVFRDWSALLWASVWKLGRFGFPWGLVFPLAVAGLVLRWRSVPWPFLLLLTLVPAAIILVFVRGRYRIPVVPVVVLLAAGGLTAGVQLLRAGDWYRVAWAAGAALFVGIITSLPGPSCEERIDYTAELWVWMGDEADRSGDGERARDLFEAALEREPDCYLAHMRLGSWHAARRDGARAVEHLTAALALEADDYDAYFRRGRAYAVQGDDERALADYTTALTIEPLYGAPYAARARLHERRGDLAAAREDWRQALLLFTRAGHAAQAEQA